MMVGVALYSLFDVQRHGHTDGWGAGRMYAAPEGADAANAALARSGRLWSMVRCIHSYVHDGPSSTNFRRAAM
jgi:hypothetical protein